MRNYSRPLFVSARARLFHSSVVFGFDGRSDEAYPAVPGGPRCGMRA